MQPVTLLDLTRLRAVEWLREVDHHDELASTNDLAIARLRRGDIAPPALIVADAQTAGRGRGANRWWSTDGGLTFTLVVAADGDGAPGRQRLEPRYWPCLALSAATAVATVLESRAPSHSFGVRWPNDVFTEDRKISGILVEAPVVGSAESDATPRTGTAAKHLVIGIGLNVNNSMSAAPADVRERATSMRDLTGTAHDLTGVLIDLVDQVNSRLVRLADGDETLSVEWQALCLLRGRTVTLEVGRRRVRGTCHGIQPDGALAIHSSDGTEHFYGGVLSEVV